MSQTQNDLILEELRYILCSTDRLRLEMSDVKSRMRLLEMKMRQAVSVLASHVARLEQI
jgi:hypothetical protein